MINEDNSPDQEKEVLDFLENEDLKYGKNTANSEITRPEPITQNSLGQSKLVQMESTISGANDNFWKNIPLQNLPSKGRFYPNGAELTVRAATASEIRHWSTIDDDDILDIDDKLNFIIEKCSRFKVNAGQYWLTWRDILEVDRLYIIFVIHEITFPDGQNELFSKFECTATCSSEERFSSELKIRSQMLQLFDLPEELEKWYSDQYSCFEVISTKLNETFYLYLPTLGTIERLRKRISEIKGQGQPVDKAFIKIAPYLIQDWSKLTREEYNSLSAKSFSWHINKFTFVTKFAELIQDSRKNSVSTVCPKCGSVITSSIFSRNGFTIKDFFLISGRLDELV